MRTGAQRSCAEIWIRTEWVEERYTSDESKHCRELTYNHTRIDVRTNSCSIGSKSTTFTIASKASLGWTPPKHLLFLRCSQKAYVLLFCHLAQHGGRKLRNSVRTSTNIHKPHV